MTPSPTTPQEAEPREDGWIEWTGGENPVGNSRVEIKFRMGDTLVAERASGLVRWAHRGVDHDIIAYRVVSPAPAAPTNGGGERTSISQDGPYAISRHRYWLARQLLDSKLSDEEAYGIVAYSPAVSDLYDRPQPTQQGGAERSGVYVASRASIPERSAMWRMHRAHGQSITSTWIDEAGEGESHDLGELWERIEREVTSSKALILYAAKKDFPLKGAFIEIGMALAARVPVFVVLDGVDLEPRSLRPLGSWAKHPLVTFAESVTDAFRLAALKTEKA